MTGVGAPAARVSMASSLALAMGVQAATARHLGVKDVTTVVVTSTLTGLAADSRLGAARGQGALRRGAAVTLIIVGAATGAALCQVHAGLAVLAAAFVVLAVTGLGHLSTRSVAAATAGSTTSPTSRSLAPAMAPTWLGLGTGPTALGFGAMTPPADDEYRMPDTAGLTALAACVLPARRQRYARGRPRTSTATRKGRP